MRISDINSTRFFVCNPCRVRTDGETDVRAIANNGEPSVPCDTCGAVEWDELTGDDRREIVEHLGAAAIGNAVVFCCTRCRNDGVHGVRAGERPTRCVCGSRHFQKLIGPELIKYLRKRRDASETIRASQSDGSSGQ